MSKKPKQIHLCEACNAVLPVKRKCCDDRCEQIQLCKSKGTQRYKTQFVAPDFQAMIRAEAGAATHIFSHAVRNGELVAVGRLRGQCVCITCGQVCPWSGGSFTEKLDTGHFLSGRGSILFEEDCVAPQCATCNRHHGGRPLEFRKWMEAVRGLETIERLEHLKRQTRSFSRDELVDMRLEFRRRQTAAILTMKGTT